MLRPVNPFNKRDVENAREELDRYNEELQRELDQRLEEELDEEADEDAMHVEPRDRLG